MQIICKASEVERFSDGVINWSQRVIKKDSNYYFQSLRGEEIKKEIEIDGEFIKDLAFNFFGYEKFRFDFVDGIDWEKLAKHHEVEIEESIGIGYNHPEAGKPNPKFGDYKFYAQVNENKYLYISKDGKEHGVINPDEAGHGVEFP